MFPGRGQNSLEYMLFIAASIIFVSGAILVSRGNTTGMAAGSIVQGEANVQKVLGSFQPGAPIISNVAVIDSYQNGKYGYSITWKTDIPSTSSATYWFVEDQSQKLVVGNNKITVSHQLFIQKIALKDLGVYFTLTSCIPGSLCSTTDAQFYPGDAIKVNGSWTPTPTPAPICNPGDTTPCYIGACLGYNPCINGTWGACVYPPTCNPAGTPTATPSPSGKVLPTPPPSLNPDIIV